MPNTDSMLEVHGLSKRFGLLEVFSDVNFSVQRGEIIALIGPSRTGKSTLLRCLNFLEHPTAGRIRIGDVEIDARQVNKKEITRLRSKTAIVFQGYALFKNQTALENIMEPLVAVQGWEKRTARKRAEELLATVGLTDKMSSYPSRLSGGQQQRVGIARALAVNPDVILFDEPTSSLDPELVGEVLAVIQSLSKVRTMLIATHEIEFARCAASRVFFLCDGCILEHGTPEQVLNAPKEERTRQFLRKLTPHA